MNKLFLSLTALVFCVLNGLAQTYPDPLVSPAVPDLFAGMNPVARAIVAAQIAGKGIAQKPTSSERLIAIATTGIAPGSVDQDSIIYQYSGNRGSLLSNDPTTYTITYNTMDPVMPGSFTIMTPSLLFDTAKYYQKEGTTYFMTYQSSQTFDANDRIVGLSRRLYALSGICDNADYTAININAEGKVTESLLFSDTSTNIAGQYEKVQRLGAVYSGGLRTQDTVESWSASNSYYSKESRIYSYNGAGLMDTCSNQQFNTTDGTWKNYTRYRFYYDGLDRLQRTLTDSWNGTGWVLQQTDSLGYTGNNALFTFRHRTFFNGASFILVERIVASLTSFGAWDSVYHYDYGHGLDTPDKAYQYLYNANQHITNVDGYVLIIPGVKYQHARYYYEPLASGVMPLSVAPSTDFATLAPNPARNHAIITINNPRDNAHLTVANMAGQILYDQNGPAMERVELNTATLPAGIYNVTLRMGSATQTLKLVKE